MTIQELAEYYSGLLIAQYKNKSKAKATIELIIKILIPENSGTENLLILDVQDAFDINTAVGVQLNILDKYIGCGGRGTLDDDDFRFLLKLKIIQNSSDHSFKSINDSLYSFFGTDVYMTSSGNMSLTYYVPSSITSIIDTIISRKLLPVPMGVDFQAVLVSSGGGYFGFSRYESSVQPANGFTTYSDITKDGDILMYDDILL